MTPLPRKSRLIPLAAAAVALALPGAAHANNPTFTVDCTFAMFDMPSTQAGTVVTAWLNGDVFTTSTATEQGQRVTWHAANRSYWEEHTWRVLVDAPFDQPDEEFNVTVGPCRTDTPDLTVPSTISTTTAPPAVPSTVAPTFTTPPVVTSVPPTSTPVTTPRPATLTTVPTLPETGGNVGWLVAAAIAFVCSGLALSLVRRGGRS